MMTTSLCNIVNYVNTSTGNYGQIRANMGKKKVLAKTI